MELAAPRSPPRIPARNGSTRPETRRRDRRPAARRRSLASQLARRRRAQLDGQRLDSIRDGSIACTDGGLRRRPPQPRPATAMWMAAVLATATGVGAVSHAASARPARPRSRLRARRHPPVAALRLADAVPPGIDRPPPAQLEPVDLTSRARASRRLPRPARSSTLHRRSVATRSFVACSSRPSTWKLLERERGFRSCLVRRDRPAGPRDRSATSSALGRIPLAETRSDLERIVVGDLPHPYATLVNVPVLDYVVDFLWPAAMFVVEADGGHPGGRNATGTTRDVPSPGRLRGSPYSALRLHPSGRGRRIHETLTERIPRPI